MSVLVIGSVILFVSKSMLIGEEKAKAQEKLKGFEASLASATRDKKTNAHNLPRPTEDSGDRKNGCQRA